MPTHGAPDPAQFRITWTGAMMELRLSFTLHGYDVNGYTDEELHCAIVAEAIADVQSSRDADTPTNSDLFTRAFDRLQKGGTQDTRRKFTKER